LTNAWAALVLMVFEHVNKYLYAEKLPVISQFRRIVMPMFGFVLACNLARLDALARGVHGRMRYRLTLMGLAASPSVHRFEWHVRRCECMVGTEHFVHAPARGVVSSQ
jgi:hypothetical protein